MVYISKLNKNLFPLYIPPQDEELFSSWFCRVATNHQVKPITFSENYFGKNFPVWNRDIDCLAPSKIINTIKLHTPLNSKQIKSLFLEDYTGKAFDNLNKKGHSANIIPLGIKHRRRTKPGQLYCPLCLNKEIPYYKKQWRLLTSIVCTECNHYLLDQCPKCNAPISFFRINMTNTNDSISNELSLKYCSECFYDLSSAINEVKPTKLDIEYQLFINNTINNGYNNITNYSFLFIKGIFLLAKRLRSSKKNNTFRYSVLKNINKDLTIIDRDFKFWNLIERQRTLPIIYSILLEFPNRISNIMDKGNVNLSSIYGERERIPYWLENIIINRPFTKEPFL